MAVSKASADDSFQSAADGAGSRSQTKALSISNGQNSRGNANSIHPKGRARSKLSSRHNRRKRRERDPSTKKPCGVKRTRDRIPIPSFTPIAEDYRCEHDVRVDENTDASGTLKASSSACRVTEVSDSTKPIADASKETLMNIHSTNQTHKRQKSDRNHYNIDEATGEAAIAATHAKKQKNAPTVEDKDESREKSEKNSNVDCGSLSIGKLKEDMHQIAEQKHAKKPSGSATLNLSITRATLRSRMVQEQPAAKVTTKKSFIHCLPLPAPVEGNEVGNKKTIVGLPLDAEDSPKKINPDVTGEAAFPIHLSEKHAERSVFNKSSSPALTDQAMKRNKPSSDNVRSNSNKVSGDTGATKSGCNGERTNKKMRSNVNKGTKNQSHTEMINDGAQKPGVPPKGKECDLDIEPYSTLNNSSVRKGNASMLNESTPPPLIQQVKKKQTMCSDITDKDDKLPKNIGYIKSSPPEVIEIIDDGDDNDDVNGGVVPKDKKKQALKSTIDKKKKNPKQSSQRRKKNKRPVSISRSSSDSSSGDELAYNAKKAKATRKRTSPTKQGNKSVKVKESKASKQTKKPAGNKLCFACSTCKCSSRAGSVATPQKPSSLSGSDARQEQSLVNRLQRIERDIAWKQGQRNEVARELKKRRGIMLKKWETQSSNSRAQRPRFLADAVVSEELGDTCSKLSTKEVERARIRMFGKQKRHQQTLTQIIASAKDDEDDDKLSELDPNEKKARRNCTDEDGAKLHDDEGDFLSFWDDSVRTEQSTQCLGSMSYFHRAVANAKDMNCTGKWAKATANTLQIEEAEGFHALVDLFDSSMEKNESNGCIDCSPNSTDDGDNEENDADPMIDGAFNPISSPLSPKGKSIAKEIETSVEDNPQKLAAIERICPNWKENVRHVQGQTDPEDLYTALQNVKEAKRNLASMKDKILRAFFDRQQTLQLYEKCLQGSINRLLENEGENGGIGDE